MKMRKKLAALLAAAMIASVMPMTAFAASTNTVSNTVRFAKETTLVKGSTAPNLKVELKHDLQAHSTFYLELTGAEWPNDVVTDMGAISVAKDATTTMGGITVSRTGAKFLTVTAGTTIPAGMIMTFPLVATLKGGEATIEVDGDTTAVTSEKFVFANSSEGVASEVIVADADAFAEKGSVANITIKEPYAGAYKAAYLKADGITYEDIELELELRDTDFFFSKKPANADVTKETRVEARRGFTFTDTQKKSAIASVDHEIVKVKIPGAQVAAASQAGEFVITGIEINSTRRAAKGEVKAILRGVGHDNIIGSSQTIIIAKHSEFATKLEMKKEYEVETGKEVEVEFKLSEEIAKALVENRTITFSLSKGAKFKSELKNSVTVASGVTTRDTGDYGIKVEANKDTVGTTDKYYNGVMEQPESREKYSSFEISKLVPLAGEKTEYNFKATILVPNNFEGNEVKLTAEGRALSETHEVVAAKVTRPVSIEVTPMDVKVGLKLQTGGKIVIKENAKEAVLRNYKDANDVSIATSNETATIDIRIGDVFGFENSGLKITDADIKVTEGDLVLDLDAQMFYSGVISIPVKRQSTEASTIEITNITINADRTVPEGKYSIKVGGNALSKNTELFEFLDDKSLKADFIGGTYFDPIAATDFINITTKNTEDGAGRTGAEVVSFVIGNNKFIADGEEVEMDAAPYIKDGRTMVPLRFLARALGIKEQSIKFDAGLVTIFKADGTIIQVAVGSKNLVANGMTIPMVAAAEIIDGRTYVPVTEIGGVFGVSGSWDAETQTATFK